MIPDILDQLAMGLDLDSEQAEYLITSMIKGDVDEVQAAAALMGLRAKGESSHEIASFVKVLRSHAVPIEVDATAAVDLCGTGGDRSGTFNISTAAMFIVAGAGIPVIKHGNRSISSKSGSADVLEALGVQIELSPERAAEIFHEIGLIFLFAPLYHPLLKQIGSVRKRLGVRTLFNLLGPLLNPAYVKRQVIGAYSKNSAEKIHSVAPLLEMDVQLTVHATDGLDEVSLHSSSWLYEYRDGISAEEPLLFNPSDFDLQLYHEKEFIGGDALDNAAIIRSLLENEATKAQEDIVLVNAAFGILTGSDGITFHEAHEKALESLRSGAAKQIYSSFVLSTQA